MLRFETTLCWLLVGAGATMLCGCVGDGVQMWSTTTLSDGWSLCAAANCGADGVSVSTVGFDDGAWLAASLPTTVMAALVADGGYPDLYVGTRLDEVATDQFAEPWWYRTEFELAAQQLERSARLVLEGVNYSAELWINGVQLAAREELVGAFRVHEIDLRGHLRPGVNAIALKVFPPQPGDFTIGFVDWNPRPPDANMGVWRPVKLRLTGDVSVEDVAVASEVDLETLASARLRVSANVVNHSDQEIRSVVTGSIGDGEFSADVVLAPFEKQRVTFGPEHYQALRIAAPRLWWPHTLGEPALYALHLEATIDGDSSDVHESTFGIREVSTYLNEQGHRGFKVNGTEVLIRGGGWVDDLLLAGNDAHIEAQMAYAKHMGLNTIRLEGFWGSSQHLYDVADREGMLVMAGWSCQWEWEEYLGGPVDERYGGVLEPADMDLVAASLADQVRWLRHHPSIFTWVLASDLLPKPELERRYRDMLAEVDPTRPQLASCGWYESEVSGPTAVKMNGPYDWVPPVYWYSDRERGGAYGFNTETGPGPQPPPLESLVRMITAEHLWPPDEMWDFHCGRNEFNTIDRYREAVDRRYGESASVEEFLRKSQAASYEAIRPMFEAFAVRRPEATGVIQWMLNSAWPEMYWQLYDSYLMPNGAFYGTRAACRPLGLAYDYHEEAVYAVNDTREARDDLSARVRILDAESRTIVDETQPVAVAAGSSVKLVDLAGLQPATPVYFLDLRLVDGEGAELSRNFYWLPTVGDELDPEAAEWFVTPVKRYADLGALERLAPAELALAGELETAGDDGIVTARLGNPSRSLAFFVELRVVDADDRSILPVLWDDNYVSLLPGEERVLHARLPGAGGQRAVTLHAAGFNTGEASLALVAAGEQP